MLLYLVRHYAGSNCVARPKQKVIIATILGSAAIPGVFCIGELESSANVRLELYDLLPSYIVYTVAIRARRWNVLTSITIKRRSLTTPDNQ